MDIKDIFVELGLKEEHLKLYLASLEWGETSITNLSERAKIARTTAYDLLEELITKGLIIVSLKHKQKNYAPVDPEILVSLLQHKELQVQNLILKLRENMNNLKTMQNTSNMKPKLHYLEGAEGIKQAYEMTFSAKEVLVQCLTDDYGDVSENFFEDYFERFFKHTNIKSKEILVEGSDTDDEYVKKYSSGKNLQLRIPASGDLSTDFILFDNTVIFVSFDKKNSYALVIEDPKVANCMRIMFNNAWENAARLDNRIKRGEKVLTQYEGE